MIGSNKKKCIRCNGEGEVLIQGHSIEPCKIVCPECKGLGVPLRTVIEEQFEEASSLDGTIIYVDETNHIDFEEEDYEY